jgi:hypothetical protein
MVKRAVKTWVAVIAVMPCTQAESSDAPPGRKAQGCETAWLRRLLRCSSFNGDIQSSIMDVGSLFQSQQKLELTHSPGITSIDFPAIPRCFTDGGCEQPSRA